MTPVPMPSTWPAGELRESRSLRWRCLCELDRYLQARRKSEPSMSALRAAAVEIDAVAPLRVLAGDVVQPMSELPTVRCRRVRR